MKRSELLKLLKEHGCKIVGHGSNHDKVHSPINGETFPLWRHSKDMNLNFSKKCYSSAMKTITTRV